MEANSKNKSEIDCGCQIADISQVDQFGRRSHEDSSELVIIERKWPCL